MNHSCDPNCEMEKWNVNGLWRMAVFAKRDILPGEEITYDYNFSLFNTDQGQECKCGSQDCRGVIGGKGKDFLITVNDDAMSASPNRKMSVATDPTGQVAADERWFKSKVVKEELALIVKMAPVPQQLEAKTLKCTVCNECLNFKAQGQIQRHPELGEQCNHSSKPFLVLGQHAYSHRFTFRINKKKIPSLLFFLILNILYSFFKYCSKNL